MLSLYGYRFVRLMVDLQALEAAPNLTGIHDQRSDHGFSIAVAQSLADELKLQSSLYQINTICRVSLMGGTDDEIRAEISQLRVRVEEDCKSANFIFIDKTEFEFYGKKNAFGNDVERVFGDSLEDIEQAGNCLAVGQGAACVFHLMRAMEAAVKSIGTHLGVTNVEKEWGKILSDMDDKIKLLPKGQNADEWSACRSNL